MGHAEPGHDDDGIPVLTDVLRLGSGPVIRTRDESVAREDDPVLHALVIGNEPPQGVESYLQEQSVAPADAAPSTDPQVDLIEDFVVTSHQEFWEESATPHFEAVVAIEPAVEAIDESATSVVEEHTPDEPDHQAIVDEAALVDASKPAPFDDEALAVRLRDEFTQGVLDDLSSRIDTELDARIAQAMRAEVENALGGLQVQLREHLGDALRDVVRRAVDDEMTRLRSTRGD